jgi:CRISPR system Cascade subunit CasE
MIKSPMFISRLTFRREPGALGALVGALRQGLDDAGRAHHLLWTLFAEGRDNPKRDFLFRAGGGARSPDGDFLVVSDRPPADHIGFWNVETKPYEPHFASGQTLAFKLRANPTVARDGKRHDVVMDRKRTLGKAREEANAEIWEQAGRDWLDARAARLGIAVLACRADGYRVHRIPRSGDRALVSIAALDLSGRLRVEDERKLTAALFSGVGHGKAWGCGLLLVRGI